MDDYEALRQLKARYFRLLDAKDWDGYEALFAEDLVADTTGSGGERFEGRSAYMAFMRTRVNAMHTVHHGHTAEIELTSPTTASAIWAMEDRVAMPGGPEMNGQGHYHETYEKTDGTWRIKSLRLTRIRLNIAGETRWF